MGVQHLGPGGIEQEIQRLWSALKAVSKATLQNGSIGRAGLRVYDGGWISIEDGGLSVTGQASVTGLLGVSGTALISGLLTGTGSIDWFGPSIFRGTLNVTGNAAFGGTLDVLGSTTISGAVTLDSDLTLGTGRILSGGLIIDKFGPYAGRIYGTSALVLDAATAVLINNDCDVRGILLTDGLDVDGPKNFRISHPTKPGYWLRHGSTESPVSGTQYHGRLTLDATGEGVVELPEYFEALNKPEGRTVQLTAVGRPFPVGADDVVDGQVKVYGDPGRDVFWTVNAERKNADFPLEEEIPPEKRDDDE